MSDVHEWVICSYIYNSLLLHTPFLSSLCPFIPPPVLLTFPLSSPSPLFPPHLTLLPLHPLLSSSPIPISPSPPSLTFLFSSPYFKPTLACPFFYLLPPSLPELYSHLSPLSSTFSLMLFLPLPSHSLSFPYSPRLYTFSSTLSPSHPSPHHLSSSSYSLPILSPAPLSFPLSSPVPHLPLYPLNSTHCLPTPSPPLFSAFPP